MQIKLTFFKRLLSVVTGVIFCTKLLMAQSMPALPANQLVMPSEAYTVSFHW